MGAAESKITKIMNILTCNLLKLIKTDSFKFGIQTHNK